MYSSQIFTNGLEVLLIGTGNNTRTITNAMDKPSEDPYISSINSTNEKQFVYNH